MLEKLVINTLVKFTDKLASNRIGSSLINIRKPEVQTIINESISIINFTCEKALNNE